MSEAFFEFVQMGGHGIYVWPPYFLSAAVLGANYYFARRRLSRARKAVLAE